MPWNYLYRFCSKLTRSEGIIAIREHHSGGSEAQKERQDCTKDFLWKPLPPGIDDGGVV